MPGYKKAPSKKPQKQTQKKTGRKNVRKNVRRRKKATTRDFGQALALTAVLIVVSAVISMAVLSIKRGRNQQTFSLSAPEVIQDVIPPEITAPETPIPQIAAQEKPPAEKPAPAPQPPQETHTPAVKQSTPAAPAPDFKPAAKPQSQPKSTVPVNNPPARQQPRQQPMDFQPEVVKTPVAARSTVPPELPPKPEHQGMLVFIIDDAGNNLRELEPFLRFPGPLTIAVLPGLPHSAEAARRIRAAGKEVFLHQPMEALGGQNPGPGAIYADMNTAEILAILHQNLAEVGPVTGMNNHQGSKITADRQMMETVLTFCREQGICFLDSRTTAETTVPAAARNLGIKIGERTIFIDNEQNRPSMNRFIESGLSRASQNGSAVMIGHTWSPELAPLLTEHYQNFIAQGYTLTTASDLINR